MVVVSRKEPSLSENASTKLLLTTDCLKTRSSSYQALARGIIESGVSVVTAYPGEPVSRIVELLTTVAHHWEMHVEWSVNEKVAYEVALGASIAGLRSLVCVKHVGFNMMLDPFVGSAYTGTGGGLVVIVGDDPSAHGSTHEEDTRYLTELAEVPLLEPATPAEAVQMVTTAYNLSEDYRLPVVLRITTGFCQRSGPVTTGDVRAKNAVNVEEGWYAKETYLEPLHDHLHRKNRELAEMSEQSEFNTSEISGKVDIGVIACGAAVEIARRVAETLKVNAGVFKVGFVRPFPVRKIVEFARHCPQILVLEEIQPFVERLVVQSLEGDSGKVRGKLTGDVPWSYELTDQAVANALTKILEIQDKWRCNDEPARSRSSVFGVSPCVRQFDLHCPHRSTLAGLRDAVKRIDEPVFVAGDVGCMSYDLRERQSTLHSMICMGASPGIATGVQLSRSRKIIAVLGDSSFYHSGLQGIMNAVWNEIPLTVVVLDNTITAQSGFQPNPGSGVKASREKTPIIPIERVAEAIGAIVRVVDAYNPRAVEDAIVAATRNAGCTVIVSKGQCPRAENAGAYRMS
jgi:indolepyruvate ferredoxin oxidoreductase alpha subunit